LDFVPASVNFWALPPKIICVVLETITRGSAMVEKYNPSGSERQKG
jgi:hypothetical protein